MRNGNTFTGTITATAIAGFHGNSRHNRDGGLIRVQGIDDRIQFDAAELRGLRLADSLGADVEFTLVTVDDVQHAKDVRLNRAERVW